MRDRLIELLDATVYENIEPDDGFVGFDVRCDKIADHLLANGVIVPPCKVGDTVYCLDTIGNPINNYVVQNVGITATQGGWGIERSFDDFGKTVFLTKKEAKKALKERVKE